MMEADVAFKRGIILNVTMAINKVQHNFIFNNASLSKKLRSYLQPGLHIFLEPQFSHENFSRWGADSISIRAVREFT
jgi:hypothetical protein